MRNRRVIAIIVLVLIAVLAISSVAAAGKEWWKGVPTTADGCVTTYKAPSASGPTEQACFKWIKLYPGYFDCQGNICWVKMLQTDNWMRTFELDVTL